MSFVSCRVEVVVGQDLLLPLQVLGITAEDPPVTLPFNDCRFMELKLSLADNAIFNVSLETKIGMYINVEIIFCILEPALHSYYFKYVHCVLWLHMYIYTLCIVVIHVHAQYIVYCGYTCTCIHCVLWLYMYIYTLYIVVIHVHVQYIVYCCYTCTYIHCILWLHMYMYMYTVCIVVAQR